MPLIGLSFLDVYDDPHPFSNVQPVLVDMTDVSVANVAIVITFKL